MNLRSALVAIPIIILIVFLFSACSGADRPVPNMDETGSSSSDGVCVDPGDIVEIEWSPGLCAPCLCGAYLQIVECEPLYEC